MSVSFGPSRVLSPVTAGQASALAAFFLRRLARSVARVSGRFLLSQQGDFTVGIVTRCLKGNFRVSSTLFGEQGLGLLRFLSHFSLSHRASGFTLGNADGAGLGDLRACRCLLGRSGGW